MIKVIKDTLDFIYVQTQSSIIKRMEIKDNKLIKEDYKENIDQQLFNPRVIGE